MTHLRCRRLTLALFWLYLAVFPGSTLTVALDLVPRWGEWMGGALLLLQGAIVLCWLLARFGRRGALAAALVFALAWGVEHVGVQTGFPFGRYSYTAMLQPQLLGIVPLAIPCAWLMVAIGADQFGRWIIEGRSAHRYHIHNWKSIIQQWVVTATLVLLLDLQIEPVATAINHYWQWLEQGRYYGVPAANFIAWWLVGLAMAVVVTVVLGFNWQRSTVARFARANAHQFESAVFRALPRSLYLLSTLMFAAINLARGYPLAGSIGVLVLLVAAWRVVPALVRRTPPPALHSLHDAPDA